MATITVTPGHTYGTTDTVTSTNLNNLGSPTAALTAGSILTADIADANVTTAKIADANVTTAKIADANVTFAKLTDVIDDDTMATATATTLATSESIKAYVDASAQTFTPSTYAGEESVTLPNGLIMKWGIENLSASGGIITFATPFPTAVVNVQGNNHGADASANLGVTSYNTTTISVNPSNTGTYHWQAIGY